MPELPDVENFRRYLRRHALHRRIERVHVGDPRALDELSPQRLGRAAKHRELAATRRHGKHLFVELDGGRRWLHFHFGMTGSLAHFVEEDEDPEHDRVRFDLVGGDHLAFVDQRLFGRIGLIDSPEAFVEDNHLGIDALSSTLNAETLRRALARKRSVKGALMDQRAIAGIGNIYADEILFQAKIAPRRAPADLDDHDLERLLRTIRQVLQEAISRGAGTDALLERIPNSWLLPRREEGASCPRCDGTIRAYESGGRRGYWCPACQH